LVEGVDRLFRRLPAGLGLLPPPHHAGHATHPVAENDADLLPLKQLLHLVGDVQVAVLEADRADQSRLLHAFTHLASEIHRGGHGLLDEERDPALDGDQLLLLVCEGRDADEDSLHLFFVVQLVIVRVGPGAVLRGGLLRLLLHHVTDGNDLHALKTAGAAHVSVVVSAGSDEC